MTTKSVITFLIYFLLTMLPLIIFRLLGGTEVTLVTVFILLCNGFIQGAAFVFRINTSFLGRVTKHLELIEKIQDAIKKEVSKKIQKKEAPDQKTGIKKRRRRPFSRRLYRKKS